MATEEFIQQLITNPDRLKNLVDEAKELALQHGFLIRRPETPNSSEVVTYSPFTLFPSPVPKAALLQALAVHTHFSTLVDKISQDPDFLEEALASTIQVDDFIAKLFGIYRLVQQEGRTQERSWQDMSIVVGLNRSDYMVEQDADEASSLKQVEINTIAVGAFDGSDCLPMVHRHTLRSVGLLKESECVQDVNTTPRMSAALTKAWELYGRQKAVVLFLVEDFRLRQLSQRFVEKELWNRNISVIRRNFEEVSKTASLDGDKRLFIDGLEVAVVYYRHGYMPQHYSEQSWDTRLLMERSRAVKCPDIGTHLAGTKKVQQVLARPGVLETFFLDQPEVVQQIRATFTGLYSLDMGPEGDQTVAMALADPHKFVLKPQREGGGNNYFGEDIVRVLEEIKGDKRRGAYILMDRIRPRTEPNILLRRGLPLRLTSVYYEIGIHGAYVRNGEEMILNETAGTILRTKSTEQTDGVLLPVWDTPLII